MAIERVPISLPGTIATGAAAVTAQEVEFMRALLTNPESLITRDVNGRAVSEQVITFDIPGPIQIRSVPNAQGVAAGSIVLINGKPSSFEELEKLYPIIGEKFNRINATLQPGVPQRDARTVGEQLFLHTLKVSPDGNGLVSDMAINPSSDLNEDPYVLAAYANIRKLPSAAAPATGGAAGAAASKMVTGSALKLKDLIDRKLLPAPVDEKSAQALSATTFTKELTAKILTTTKSAIDDNPVMTAKEVEQPLDEEGRKQLLARLGLVKLDKDGNAVKNANGVDISGFVNTKFKDSEPQAHEVLAALPEYADASIRKAAADAGKPIPADAETPPSLALLTMFGVFDDTGMPNAAANTQPASQAAQQQVTPQQLAMQQLGLGQQQMAMAQQPASAGLMGGILGALKNVPFVGKFLGGGADQQAQQMSQTQLISAIAANNPNLAVTLMQNPDFARNAMNDPNLAIAIQRDPTLVPLLMQYMQQQSTVNNPAALATLLQQRPDLAEAVRRDPSLAQRLLQQMTTQPNSINPVSAPTGLNPASNPFAFAGAQNTAYANQMTQQQQAAALYQQQMMARAYTPQMYPPYPINIQGMQGIRLPYDPRNMPGVIVN